MIKEPNLDFRTPAEYVLKCSLKKFTDDLVSDFTGEADRVYAEKFEEMEKRVADYAGQVHAMLHPAHRLGIEQIVENPYEMLEEIAMTCREAGYPLSYGTPLDQVKLMVRDAARFKAISESGGKIS